MKAHSFLIWAVAAAMLAVSAVGARAQGGRTRTLEEAIRVARAGGALTGGARSGVVWAGAAQKELPITICSANLSDNTTQAYGPAAIRILQALKPDIIGIQEFNYKEGGPGALVYELFGAGYHFARERGADRLPNGIISRYPIIDAGQWNDPYVENRNFAWAIIRIPGPHLLHVVSVHLSSSKRELRAKQARELVRLIRANWPREAYVVLCGDLNTTSRDAAAVLALCNYFDDERQPADQAGNPNTNGPRNRPYDFVLPSRRLAKLEVPTILGGKSFADGLVFDSRLWNPPPRPARWDDTAKDMQHLPVMKTFMIPLR